MKKVSALWTLIWRLAMENQQNFGVCLQKAEQKDILALFEIGQSIASKTYVPPTKEAWEKELSNPKAAIYLILKNGQAVGFVSCQERENSSAYISELGVSSRFQGQGLGRKAMQLVLGVLRNKKTITLLTHPENFSALRLYSSFGFVVKTRLENFYGDGEPRVLMEKIAR
jgi:ribosomal protein S18 acetylase RimI-like enzyme